MKNPIQFHGRGGEFFAIWIVNVLLTIITLGIYSAWAKVRTNKYFYGNTELTGDRFDYHATPIQILIGRIIAFVCVAIWAIASSTMPVVSTILLLTFIAIVPWLVRNNTRFDARMTSYRNVRFNFTGSLAGAYWAVLGRGLIGALVMIVPIFIAGYFAATQSAMAIVFGLIAAIAGFFVYGWHTAGMVRYIVNGYAYGRFRFGAEIETGFYVKTLLLAALLGAGLSILASVVLGMIAFAVAMPILGDIFAGSFDPSSLGGEGAIAFVAILFVYVVLFLLSLVVGAFVKVRTRNYLFGQLVMDNDANLEFESTMTTMSYVGLIITNFLIQLFTLGFGRPWVMVRSAQYMARTTTVYGDVAAVSARDHGEEGGSSIADEVSQAFDIELGIG